MKKELNAEELHITTLNRIRDSHLSTYEKSWDNESLRYIMEEPKEIDELLYDILKRINQWRDGLSFEFIVEQLTKLGQAPSLLYDDNGFFAVTSEGMQEVAMDEFTPTDLHINHWIEAKLWKPTIREALYFYLDNEI